LVTDGGLLLLPVRPSLGACRVFPQLSEAFKISTISVASVVGLFYYGYSPFSLVAGAAIDRLGPKTVVSAGALIAGGGAALFGTGNLVAARVGSFMEGAEGAFALVGAVYIASEGFPVSRAATLIGATQMFGMAGGWAGQFVIGPMITQGMPLRRFWVAMAALGLAVAVALYSLLPGKKAGDQGGDWLHGATHSLAIVFKNPQSILCEFIAGLLFIPTTIFSMIWGIRFLQDARGFEFQEAVVRSATVSLGWMIGCPLTGWLSDHIGLRRPVIIGGAGLLLACLLWTLYGPVDVLPPYVLSFVAGLSSGAAMLTKLEAGWIECVDQLLRQSGLVLVREGDRGIIDLVRRTASLLVDRPGEGVQLVGGVVAETNAAYAHECLLHLRILISGGDTEHGARFHDPQSRDP
jgi:MFS family permease